MARKDDKQKKAAPAKKQGPSRRERLSQIRLAFTMTRKNDPKMLPLVLGAFVIVLAVFVLLGVLFGHPVYLGVVGVMFALLVAASVFGRRVQRSAFAQVEGQVGAIVQLKSETEKMRARARLMLESGIGAEGLFVADVD